MNLREIRTLLGYTQKQMAEVLKISISYYGMVERGILIPSPRLQKKILKLFSTKGRQS